MYICIIVCVSKIVIIINYLIKAASYINMTHLNHSIDHFKAELCMVHTFPTNAYRNTTSAVNGYTSCKGMMDRVTPNIWWMGVVSHIQAHVEMYWISC